MAEPRSIRHDPRNDCWKSPHCIDSPPLVADFELAINCLPDPLVRCDNRIAAMDLVYSFTFG